jgi:hypothetical protein
VGVELPGAAATPDPLVPLAAGRNPDARPSGPTAGVAPLFGPSDEPPVAPLWGVGAEPFPPDRPSVDRPGTAGCDPLECPRAFESWAWSASRSASIASLGMRAVSSGSLTLV